MRSDTFEKKTYLYTVGLIGFLGYLHCLILWKYNKMLYFQKLSLASSKLFEKIKSFDTTGEYINYIFRIIMWIRF